MQKPAYFITDKHLFSSLKITVYRNLQTVKKYCLNKKYRKNVNEIRQDLKLTRDQLQEWGKEGRDRARQDQFFLILSFTKVPFYAKIHALIAKIAQLGGYTPLIINQHGNRMVNEYYGLMGVDNVLYWNQFVSQRVTEIEVKEVVTAILPPAITLDTLMELKYKDVEVGKHALSMVCRNRLEGRLNFDQIEVQEQIKHYLNTAIKSVIATEVLLTEYPIRKMLVRDSGYIPNGGIFETGLVHGVDCIVHDFGQSKGSWVFKRHTLKNRNEHFFSLSDESWSFLKKRRWDSTDEHQLKEEFVERYQVDSLKDTRRLQHGKLMKSPDAVREQLGLNPRKKTAVVFSHIAWDAAFFYGNCLFGDFENWLFETVKYVARECKEMNWLIKLHPFNALKLQRESKDEESEMRLLRSIMPLPDHVKIVRAHTDINTSSLFHVADYVLTVNGTVGMEFPCFGIPALLAGTGRYNHRGFSLDPETKEEYYNYLRILHKIPRLSDAQIVLAKKHYLALMRGRQTSLESVAPMELRKFNEAQSELHNNINFSPKSLREFENDESIERLSNWLLSSNHLDMLNRGFEIEKVLEELENNGK